MSVSPELALDRSRSYELVLPDDGRTRIYILGCGRSGTTLMGALMTCFEDTYVLLDDAALGGEDYAGRFLRIERPERTHVIKRSSDAYKFSHLLPEDLWLLYIVRNPLDVFVSTLKLEVERPYYIPIERWLAELAALKLLLAQERHRMLVLRYEDLVFNPDETQKDIAQKIGLTPRIPFSSYPENFSSTKVIEQSMNGVRPLSDSSVDRWKDPQHVAHIASIRPQIKKELAWVCERFNYELD